MDVTMAETSGEYSAEHFVCHEIIWGEGWMSQGGEDEVASVVQGLDLSGKTVLDIGSGLGGPSVALAANHNPGQVISIDIQAEQSALAQKLATRRGVTERITYQVVEPGPFPFEGASFDVVFSVGVFLQIHTKQSLYDDIYRVLKPGGTAMIGLYATYSTMFLWYRFRSILGGSLSKAESDRWMNNNTEGEWQTEGRQNHWTKTYSKPEFTEMMARAGFDKVQMKQTPQQIKTIPLLGKVVRALLPAAVGDLRVGPFGGMLVATSIKI